MFSRLQTFQNNVPISGKKALFSYLLLTSDLFLKNSTIFLLLNSFELKKYMIR